MITQTRAIFLDAYRELNSKKLFWVVLILNVLVILGFSLLGANSRSLTILWYELGNMRGSGIDPVFLYKYIFSYFIVGFWFTWLAAGLALVSTASIFPDFLSSGSIDLYLSRPVGRGRLFLTKYAAGLVFVAVQVTIFTVLSFLVLGLRAGLWEFGLFWAIPIVVIFFSYLYGLCTLFGVWTRSTVAALLLTLLAWFLIWGVDKVDRTVLDFGQNLQMQHEFLSQQIEDIDQQMAAQSSGGAATRLSPEELAKLDSRRALLIGERDASVTPSALITTQKVIFGIKSFVPKTRDTIVLLDRTLFADQELKDLAKQDDSAPAPAAPAPPARGMRGGRGGPRINSSSYFTSEIERDRQRSVWWILGTSLAFEAGCLALAVWHFSTRDF
jgi:ABC-type transport system involved in multi-copper enzyme maturation permease subunit